MHASPAKMYAPPGVWERKEEEMERRREGGCLVWEKPNPTIELVLCLGVQIVGGENGKNKGDG